HMSSLLALQYAVSTASIYSSHTQQLGTVDHVVVIAASHTNPSSFNLKTKGAFVLPKTCCQSNFDPWRSHLICAIGGNRQVVL
ncbi:hypothetical protein COCVIDRAFT_90126, partial [Bipolaris victoriae FI3]